MKIILHILKKEFRQIFRNKTLLPMIFWVPLMQMLILVFAATYDMKKIDMTVADNDMSETSRRLIATFNAIPFYHLEHAVQTTDEGEELLLKGTTDFVLVIPAGTEQKLIREDKAPLQLLINAMEGNSAQLIYSYSSKIIGDFNRNLVAEHLGMPEFKAPFQVQITESYWYNQILDYKWYMAPGILSVLVTIIGMFMSGMNLVREKELGTIEQLNVTPIKKHHFIIGKLVPFWIIGLIELAIGLTIAWIVFRMPVTGSIVLLFSFAGLYLISVLGLGLFISTVTHTQQQVMFMNFFFMLVFILMGGIFTPVESMPEWAQTINYVNPVYYFMRIMRQVILKGSGIFDLMNELTGLTILGIAFLSMAIWRYRKTN